MERDSFLYYLRRKCQVFARHVLSNETLSKLYYLIVLHKKLNLDNPQSFNEKIQWMKLYYYPLNPLVVQCTDKFQVREYVQSKGLGKKLVPLVGSWKKADEIDWDLLPNQFVLKCNHGCAYNIVVDDKNNFNIKKATKQLKRWLKEDFGAYNLELHYSLISPRMIICEEYLGESITDYKFFCFNGTPKYLYVSSDLIHDRQAQIGFFYLNGIKMPLIRNDYKDIKEITLPLFFDEMKNAAEVLCQDFPFVRVDFFIANNTWYFAELTFTPAAGLMPFNPDMYDLEWGKLLNIDGI